MTLTAKTLTDPMIAKTLTDPMMKQGRYGNDHALPRNHCSHNKERFSGTIIRVRSQWEKRLIPRSIIDGVINMCIGRTAT